MSQKDDSCNQFASIKPRPTRSLAKEYAFGISGLESDEDKEARRLYEMSIFGPPRLSDDVPKANRPAAVNPSVEQKKCMSKVPFPAPGMDPALVADSDTNQDQSQRVRFKKRLQSNFAPSKSSTASLNRKKAPPPIAPKPKFPPARKNRAPPAFDARPKTQAPPGSIYLPNDEDLKKDVFGDGTHELRRFIIRICDFCEKDYLASLYGKGDLDQHPFGTKSRLCDMCNVRCRAQSSGRVDETQKKSEGRRTCEPQKSPGRRIPVTYTTKAETKFYEPNLAKIPPVYDSDEDVRIKLDAATEELSRTAESLSSSTRFRNAKPKLSTFAPIASVSGLNSAPRQSTKVRNCDFCRREYIAINVGMSVEEDRPGAPSRVCDGCKYEPPKTLPGQAFESKKGWFGRKYDEPQQTQGRQAAATRTTRAEMNFYDRDLINCPTVLDSEEDARTKLNAALDQLVKKTKGFSFN